MPLPIVRATARPVAAPSILKKAARITACRGVRARVPTAVAIALAASLNPLENPSAIANIIMSARAINEGSDIAVLAV